MSFTPSGEQTVAIDIQAEDNASAAFASAETSALDMKDAVAGAGAVLAGAGVAGLAGAANAAANFESAMVEVEKVTNPETAEAMSGSIRELAETIPLAQSKLAKLAADAGRFGVEGTANMEQFVEATAKMASATNMNASQAGQAFAKLTELTGTPISEVENLGSAINELSNNTATSAREISQSMLRSAGALSQLGLNQTEIAGMSAALNEVSESAERAGTRLRRLGQEMMNPKNASQLASALGMTTAEFRQMREESPDELMLQMAEAMESGGEQADALKNVLSTTSRQALAGMAQNLEGTTNALEMSSKAYEENTSVQEEFAAASDTFNKQLQTLRNRLRNVAIVMGNQILPVLIDAMDAVTPLIDAFADVNERLDGMPALLATVGVALTGLGAVAVSVGPAIVSALSPVLVPVAAITAAVGALGYAWKTNFAGIRDATHQAWSTLKPILIAVKDVLIEVFEEYAVPMFKELSSVARAEFRAIEKQIVPTMNHVGNVIKDVLSAVGAFWNAHGERITKIVGGYFGVIELTITTTMRAISAVVQSILAIMRGDFDEVLKIIKRFWTKTFNDILAFVKGPWMSGIKAAFGLFYDIVTGIFKKLYNFLIGGSLVPKTFNEILSFVKRWIARARKTFKSFLNNLFSIWKSGLNRIYTEYKSRFKQIQSFLSSWIASAKSTFNTFLNNLFSIWKTGLTRVYSFYKDIFERITGWIQDTGATLFESAFGSVFDAIVGVVDEMRTEINTIVDTIIAQIQEALDFVTELNNFSFDIDWPDPPEIVEEAFNGELDIDWPDPPSYVGGNGGFLGGGSDGSDGGSDGSDGGYDGGDDGSDGSDGGQPGSKDPGRNDGKDDGDGFVGLATGGIVTDPVSAVIGEAGENEAVLPLSRLSQYLDTAYEVGAHTAPSSAQSGGQASQSALTATLRVEGDGELADLIREHAELVVEERDASKRARIARN